MVFNFASSVNACNDFWQRYCVSSAIVWYAKVRSSSKMEKPQRLCNSTFFAKTIKTEDGGLFPNDVVAESWNRSNGGKFF